MFTTTCMNTAPFNSLCLITSKHDMIAKINVIMSGMGDNPLAVMWKTVNNALTVNNTRKMLAENTYGCILVLKAPSAYRENPSSNRPKKKLVSMNGMSIPQPIIVRITEFCRIGVA